MKNPDKTGEYLILIQDCEDEYIRIGYYSNQYNDWIKIAGFFNDPAWTKDMIIDWAELDYLKIDWKGRDD